LIQSKFSEVAVAEFFILEKIFVLSHAHAVDKHEWHAITS
jgi:hypothetical protein